MRPLTTPDLSRRNIRTSRPTTSTILFPDAAKPDRWTLRHINLTCLQKKRSNTICQNRSLEPNGTAAEVGRSTQRRCRMRCFCKHEILPSPRRQNVSCQGYALKPFPHSNVKKQTGSSSISRSAKTQSSNIGSMYFLISSILSFAVGLKSEAMATTRFFVGLT